MTRPSYRALKAFLECVDAGSATAAGRRLGVSASAVSHLIKELEQSLDTRLFTSSPNSALTETGERLCRSVGTSFSAIDRALREFAYPEIEVRLSTVATFANLWLIPRLPAFPGLQGDVRLTISTATRVVRLGAEPFDCSIRWGRGDWRDGTSRLLFNERLVMVGAPGAVSGNDPFALPRIAALTRPEDWPTYLDAAKAETAPLRLIVENRADAVHAAARGLGVTIIDETLASDLIERGLLVRAAPATAPLEDGFHFVSSPTGRCREAVASLGDWMATCLRPARS